MCEENKEKIVLLVGSCGLDRLLTVTKYPDPDAKVRTTAAYNEVGGGNAANTASAMGKLTDASFLKKHNIRIRFLGKVGDDSVGQQLFDELNDSNVDTTSLLCLRGPPGSTTAFTTIIVSEEEHTRTCIHTPGTCDELTLEDVKEVDMDDVFQNVVHLHSDSRHTNASLILAREAKARGIPVSCDCEKDRKTKALDELVEISDLLFTNSNYLGSYLERLESELEFEKGRKILSNPSITVRTDGLEQAIVDAYAKSLTPSAFFTRWYDQIEKQVVVTQ
jgi:sugar/nucleoside kinase (ribokinase family)